MEKVYEGFLNSKFHMWSLNIVFIPLPDTLPMHNGLRKKYMAICWPGIFIGIPPSPEMNTWTQGQTLICSTKFLFKLKGKVLEDKI